jgi:hypothetical protein
MTWYFFEAQNRELRTHPAGFGATRISDITWTKDWVGQPVQAGDALAVVTFDGGAEPKVFLTAPPGCEGVVGRTFDIDPTAQAMMPSQLLLYLRA